MDTNNDNSIEVESGTLKLAPMDKQYVPIRQTEKEWVESGNMFPQKTVAIRISYEGKHGWLIRCYDNTGDKLATVRFEEK